MEATVIIDREAETVTVRGDGMSDVLYRRTITDKSTGEVIVRDVVRETVETSDVRVELDRMCKIEAEKNADSPA